MRKYDIFSIGEINPDLIVTGIAASEPQLGTEQEAQSVELTLGSSTAITTVLAQRLGMRTALVGCVGDDFYGKYCQDTIAREGVEFFPVRSDVGTGITISLAYEKDRLLVSKCGAMRSLVPADLPWKVIENSRHLHVGSYFIQSGIRSALPDIFARAGALGVTTSLDTGWDPEGNWMSDSLRETMKHLSFLFPNESELKALSGRSSLDAAVEIAQTWGVGEVVVKLGERGGMTLANGACCRRSGFSIVPVDTTGAGDAFNAGYLTAFLHGASVEERLDTANAAGALVASAIGGTGGLRSFADIESLRVRP